jgi:sugar phosphate isomerase/epimerase
MELSLSTHLLVYGHLDEPALCALAASGLSLVEVWLAEPHLCWKDARALAEFRARLEQHGLRPASVHLPFYPSVPALLEHGEKWSLIDPAVAQREIALAGTREGIYACAALGARQAVLHLGWQGDAWLDSSHGWARDAVAELLPVAHACGVELLLENIISSGTRVARLIELLDEIDPAGQAGICLDLGHAHVEGDVLAELQVALPRLRHLHLHDNDGCSDAHLAPGLGSMPWAEVLAQLQAAGYDGAGALEIRDLSRGAEAPDQVIQKAVQQARSVLPFGSGLA